MKMRKLAAALGAAALVLTAGACGKEGDPTGAAPAEELKYDVATDVAISGSPTYDKMKQRGNVIVGVKADQPNLGYKDANGERSGFDIEIARMISAKLGFDPEKIQYEEIPSANRETALQGGQIDYYVGTYSITDKRKKLVSFAGPYFIAGQDLLVKKDNTDITGPETLKGKKVCSATGSTPVERIREDKLTEDSNISEFKTYAECVSQLTDGKVDAVTTDDAILKGYAANDPENLKVVGKPFSEEKYGIGLPLTDKALRDQVNTILETSFTDGTWQKIYDATLGKSGSPAKPPALEKY